MTTPVAIVQASPVPFDLPATVAKATALFDAAVDQGAQLVVFGECWLGTYPAWIDVLPGYALWNEAASKAIHAKLRRCAVDLASADLDPLRRRIEARRVPLVIGASERVTNGPGHGTLYNSLLIFDAAAELAVHHRKLVPTYNERLVWGRGQGEGLEVVETQAGRVGGLICWEHWMPLARQALHEQAEQIHVALWPSVNEAHMIASRHYAFEGRCFVLAAGSLLRVEDLPPEIRAELGSGLLLRGYSCVIGPDGKFVHEPVAERETTLLAEIDLARIDEECVTLDVTGHYARPDVFEFAVKTNKNRR